MVLGPILRMIFGVKLGILPVTGWGKLKSDYPSGTCVLVLELVAGNTRNMRASMLAISNTGLCKDWQRAKGLSPIRVVLKMHQLKNSLVPIIPNLGVQIAGAF